MPNHRPNTKGFIREKDGTFYVGAEDLTDKANPYRGPVAEVAHDDTWLTIETDAYEGHAMLNIEALPYLRKALAKISRKIKAQAKA
jgi:hypothetical protein